MQRLLIRHSTRYDYNQPVGFGLHHLLLRPRDSHALRLIDAQLSLYPFGDVIWRYDALGNCVCTFNPQGQSNYLEIVSSMVVERYPAPIDLPVQDPHSSIPVIYSPPDRMLLEPLIAPETWDQDGAVTAWMQGLAGPPGEPALEFIKRVNTHIRDTFTYQARDLEGVQSPSQTLAMRSGACRDFAWLMVEALRSYGFAARFVSGYIYSPGTGLRGAGATHAWCEVFLPSMGWIEFDPTNGLAESPDLIPVAVARTPSQAMPVSGELIGLSGGSSMTVSVSVDLADPAYTAAA